MTETAAAVVGPAPQIPPVPCPAGSPVDPLDPLDTMGGCRVGGCPWCLRSGAWGLETPNPPDPAVSLLSRLSFRVSLDRSETAKEKIVSHLN